MNRIRMAGIHYQATKAHLFPGDEKEAVVIALCGRSTTGTNQTLVVQEVIPIPYEACYERTGFIVHWPTDLLIPFLEKAVRFNLAIVKIHCHPGWYEQFSETDTESDEKLFASIHAWLDNNLPHGSCIMLPDGRLFGRFINAAGEFEKIEQILVAGSTIHNWLYSGTRLTDDELQIRNMQAFGEKTIRMLNKMKIGVVGCSGTGSPVIEQLKRLGVGELVLVDPDIVAKVNLNRILNATLADAVNETPKVNVMERSVTETGFSTKVTVFNDHVNAAAIVKTLAECDTLFGCVDGAEARHILNLISSFYLIPYFDLGVRLEADGNGGINSIFGTVHYIQPGGSSLLSRGQYSMEQLKAESLKRVNPSAYEELNANKYLINVNESSPAVISVNMQVAATAINDFLGRLHAYRNIPNTEIDATRILLHEWAVFHESLKTPCPFFAKMTGRGDIDPLLNNSSVSHEKKAA